MSAVPTIANCRKIVSIRKKVTVNVLNIPVAAKDLLR